MASAYYWVGQDGNAWMKAPDGSVSNAGRALSASPGGFTIQTADGPTPIQATQIADPAVHQSASAAPAGGSAAPAHPPLNQGAVNNTQSTIDQIPALLAAALGSEDTSYGNTVNQANAQEAAQHKTYDDSTVTNTKNYDSNFMDSIRAGIKGLGGLMSLLRGTGAGGSSVENNVRDTVGSVTSNDIRGGADTRDANQTTLDNTLSGFLTDLGIKRKQNEDTHVNNTRSIERDSKTQLQDLYGKMAGFYGDAGDTGTADSWMGRAGALTPDIAANSKTQVSPYDTTPIVVHAPNLTAFAGPTQPNVIAPPSDGQVGTGIFTMAKKKTDTAPAAAGA